MAHSDKESYESYQKDAFDNPPAGPVGVHRGKRSLGVRVAPFIVVVIVAALAGLLAWGAMSGELAEIQWPWQSQTSDDGAAGDDADAQDGDAADDDAAAGDDASDGGQAADGDQDTDADAQGGDATQPDDAAQSDNAGQPDNTGQTDPQAGAEQPVNYATGIRVINAAGINGYAGQQAAVLQGAGYTNVVAANPSGGALPSANVVWYQNEADLATARNVASTLGIADVQQATGIAAPIVVVYITAQ